MRISVWITVLAVGALLPAPVRSQDKAEVALRAAMEKESVEGNLKAAIEEYRKLAQNSNKSVAARALVRLGECYEKQGSVEARKTYEQVLSKFGDQPEAAAQARARLAALGSGRQAGQLSTRLVSSSMKWDVNSISPDGRYASCTDWDTGNLMLHDFVSGADRALTIAGSTKNGERSSALRSAISKDGRQIAYEWWDGKVQRYDLYVASLSGDPSPRSLLKDRYTNPSDWSLDGKWIAASVSERDGNQVTWQIALINPQDGSRRVLKSLRQDSGYVRTFGISPDGKYILYSQMTQNTERTQILSLDGKSDVPLVSESNPIPPLRNLSPVWTPDGSRIVFGADHPAEGLWLVHVADGRPVGAPERIMGVLANAHPIGFTRDGALFYDAPSSLLDIYIAGLDPARGKLTSEPKHVNERTPGQSWVPRWLPDGKSVSYWSRRNGRDALVVHTLATGAERELWSIDVEAGGPGCLGWFPDGSLLQNEVNGQKEILRRIDSQTMQVRASWTIPARPLGLRAKDIAFQRDMMTVFFPQRDQAAPCDAATCTYVMVARDFETGRDREVVRLQTASLTDLSISPDGREVAFIAGTNTGPAVMVAPSAGGTPRELYRGPGRFFNTTLWTQDGAHVLVFSHTQSGSDAWSIPVKGGAPEKSSLRLSPGNAAVSPDGTQIVFAAGKGGPGVWAMTGLVPEAKPAPAR
jgi:Tol biopolymer transport system component